jgi:acyl transferase domain-containing protein
VIRGSALNNDGSDKVGYLAPSVGGQARVISEALDLAGVAPEDVSYIEAHGTGTLIGDPIEIAALVQAFGPEVQTQSCAIGSVKSNIGHAGEAAGMCSLIKTICALEHRELPPSLHYQTPNPQADLSNSPFFVNASLRPWSVAPARRGSLASRASALAAPTPTLSSRRGHLDLCRRVVTQHRNCSCSRHAAALRST